MEVERKVLLSAQPARVWEALSDPDQLSAWFGAEAAIDLRPGGHARFRWPDGTERGGVVEAVEQGRLLVFRWLPFERAGRGRARLAGMGRVRVALEPREGGTLLTVVESGPPAGIGETRPPGLVGGGVSLERFPPAAPGPVIRAGAR